MTTGMMISSLCPSDKHFLKMVHIFLIMPCEYPRWFAMSSRRIAETIYPGAEGDPLLLLVPARLRAPKRLKPDVPPENIMAMFDTAYEIGKYPIQ